MIPRSRGKERVMKSSVLRRMGVYLVLLSLLWGDPGAADPQPALEKLLALQRNQPVDAHAALQVFEFSEATLLEAMKLTAPVAGIRRLLAEGKTADALSGSARLVAAHPLCYPGWTLLAAATLMQTGESSARTLAGGSVPLQRVLDLIMAGFQGNSGRVTELKRKLLQENRNWWPMFKILPMLPESIVDFRDKAEFNRRCLKEAAAWRWNSVPEMMAVNGIISALEAEGGCRRIREESGLMEKGTELLCPLGVKIVSGPGSPHCPIHRD